MLLVDKDLKNSNLQVLEVNQNISQVKSSSL